MRSSSLHLVVAAVTTFLAPLAAAQTDGDIDLLMSQKTAPPNIVILTDNSESMAQVMWHAGFDSKRFHTPVCDIAPIAIPGSANMCPDSQDPLGNGSCPDNEDSLEAGLEVSCAPALFANIADPCSAAPVKTPGNPQANPPVPDTLWTCKVTGNKVLFTLPDYTPQSEKTLWAKNYLAWIFQGVIVGQAPRPLQYEDRLEAAKRVLKKVVGDFSLDTARNHNARFGSAKFNGISGATIDTPVGSGNFNSFESGVNGLSPRSSSPLAEALVEIAQYISGNDQIGVTSDLAAASIPESSPMNGVPCAKNFVIILTDGTSEEDGFEHFTKGDFKAAIGDYDKDGYDPNSRPGVPSYRNGGTDWLDDVALYLYKNDLRPAALRKGAQSGTQNILTYVVGFNTDHPLLIDAARKGDGKFLSASSADGLAAALKEAIDDILLRTASFSAASIPSTRTSFDDALFTAFFEPSKQQVLWAGHLQAYRIGANFEIFDKDGKLAVDPTSGEFFEPRTTYYWDAATRLSDPADPLYVKDRSLYFNPGSLQDPNQFNTDNLTAARLGVSSAELAAYPNDPNKPFASEEALADAIVRYVQGSDAFDVDRDNDPNERRSVVLGDIFHSNPVVIGAPSPLLGREKGYGPLGAADPNNPLAQPSFLDRYARRDRVIYAGANDGMLHAFDAGSQIDPDGKALSGDERYSFGTGVERFGYVPRSVLPNLKNLVKKDAAKPFFVDASPSAADVWLPSGPGDVTKEGSEWASVLLVGLRNGGDAYLALDVTDPKAASGDPHGPYPKLLWEFSDAAELQGRTWERPVLTRVKLKAGVAGDFCGEADRDGADSPASDGDCRETWVAIFGGGYREQGDPGLTASFIGSPSDPNWHPDSRSIYMLELATGQVLARAVFTATDPELQHMLYAIPSAPAVADLNADGFADVVYIGDLGGQLWKWDISAVGQRSGATGLVGTSSWPVGRIFIAEAGSNQHLRQIFYPPSLSRVNGRLTLAFGTGERTALGYDSSAGVDENHFYVLRDDHPTGAGAFPKPPHETDQLTRVEDSTLRDSSTGDLGFYVPAADDEKFVTESTAFQGYIVTLGYDPDLEGAPSVCEKGGSAILHVFSLADGSGYFSDAAATQSGRSLRMGSGLPTSPRISHLGETAHIVVQTSTGRLIARTGPKLSKSAVEWIFWRQQQ
jgi:hypothetical protein